MSNNKSGDRTKLLLSESLRELMKKKPFDKIKVLEIVENCNVNRQTFYYHFQDVYELVEWMYNRETELIYEKNKNSDWHELAHNLLSFIDENNDELISIIDSKASLFFNRFITSNIKRIISDSIEKSSSIRINNHQLRFISDFYTYAFCGVVNDWIRDNNSAKMSIDEFVKYLDITMSGNIGNSVEKFSDIK